MLKKLQIKFVMINMTMVTIMLLVIFGLLYRFTERNLEAESINMMRTIAADPFQVNPPDAPSGELKLPFFSIQLSVDGSLVSTGGGFYDLSDEIFLRDVIAETGRNTQEVGIIKDHNLRYCRVKRPMGTVLVFSDMSSEKKTLGNLLRSFCITGGISFLIFLCISIFFAKWAVKPVDRAWKQQKQFVADASHELKTPLTVILTNTELLQCEDFADEERKSFLQSIQLMSEQMRFLVEKLLLLARSEKQELSMRMESVSLSSLVCDWAISFEGIFAEKGLVLESSVEPDICVYGNAEYLQQVVEILLDNAQKYSAAQSVSCITLSRTERRKCCLKVSSHGAEISKEELSLIFQRFYRTDKARSHDGSFGLGLSIAENIVHQHKGRIWAESTGGVNSFYVELPVR